MDLGLYTLKHPFAKLIDWLIAPCRNVHPNWISMMVVPIGAVTALAYFTAPDREWLYIAGVGLILLRMVVATLDGLVAVTFGKSSPSGEIVNRVAPECADAMLLVALVLSRDSYESLIPAVLVVAWLTSFSGLIGLVARRPIQSVGPVGQTDRLAALFIASILQYAGHILGWQTDFIQLFLLWTIAGGVVTIALRLWRTLRAPSSA